jgi:hypothetical protein
MCWQLISVLQRRRLPVADRLTMVPLLGALLDYDSDPDTYARYDAMTARELFRQYGASCHGCYTAAKGVDVLQRQP